MKKLVLCALGVLVSSAVNGQQATQWSGNNHWYQVVKVPSGISWENARDRAVAMGGYLATANDSAENNHIKSLLTSDAAIWADKGVGPWLGGYQKQGSEAPGSEGQNWFWLTGETFSNTSWKSGQPDNGFMGANEGYLHYLSDDITSVANIDWNDASNQPVKYSPVSFVVEFESDPNIPLQKSWQDVALNDTQHFDLNCEYRVSSEVSDWWQYPVAISKERILSDVSTAQFAFGVILHGNKSQQQYLAEGQNQAPFSAWTIYRMQKRC